MLSSNLLLLLLPTSLYSYVVPRQLPRHKQVEWLTEMTDHICSTAPGGLSDALLDEAHRCLGAWSHLQDTTVTDALQAEALAKRVVDERLAGNTHAVMTLQDYNALLEGWARSAADPNQSGTLAAQRCELILREMQAQKITPNRASFKAVLMAWRQAAGQQLQEKQQQKKHKQHNNNNNKSKQQQKQQLSLDSDPRNDACIRAHRVLDDMVELYRTHPHRVVCPDADCFDVVLQTWAKSDHPDAPHHTEQLVLNMERLYKTSKHKAVKPRTSNFNSILAAWARSDKPGRQQHTLEILEFMEKCAEHGDTTVEPDLVSYATVIGALARYNPDIQVAESLLHKIEHKYHKQGNDKFEPDTVVYNSVISCIARSNQPGAYRKARSLLDRQMRLSDSQQKLHPSRPARSRPDVYGFTSVLASCALEKREKDKAFQVALASFQELRNHDEQKYGKPNHVTYGTMLKCCALLLDRSNPLRKKWATRVWDMCVQDGCVGDMALSRMREASPELFKEVMSQPGVDKRRLPKAWTRNVDEKRDLRKRKAKRKTGEV